LRSEHSSAETQTWTGFLFPNQITLGYSNVLKSVEACCSHVYKFIYISGRIVPFCDFGLNEEFASAQTTVVATPEQCNAPGAYSFQPSGGLLPLAI
jgi:hypothetical protein